MILLHCIHDFIERINCLKKRNFYWKKEKPCFPYVASFTNTVDWVLNTWRQSNSD